MQRSPEVLLIDADRKRGTMLRSWLKQWEYRCETATNSNAACTQLEAEEGAAIVLTFLFSFKTGAEKVIEQLARTRDLRPLHVIRGLTEQPKQSDRQSLAEFSTGFRPGDAIVLPLEPRLLRGKLRSAERVIEVQQELAQAARALRFFSTHDALTALPHRGTAIEVLRREMDRSQRTGAPLSAVLFDVDQFGQFNSLSGFEAGNSVLRQIGDRLRSSMRGYDVAARYGSDTFLLLLPECTLEDAARRAERLRTDILGRAFELDHQDAPGQRRGAAQITACAGVAISDGRHPDFLLRGLENALALARKSGPGTVVIAGGTPEFAAAVPPSRALRSAPQQRTALIQ